MEVKEIAERCVAIWRSMDPSTMWFESIRRYYSDDAVNAEPMHWMDMPPEAVGKQAILAKYERCGDVLVEHSYRFDGPYYDGKNRFAVRIEADLSASITGKRATVTELGMYTVEAGKVVREEFLYDEGLAEMWRGINEAWSKQKT